MTQPHPAILRHDYLPPQHLVEQLQLHVDLRPRATRVRSTLALRRHPEAPAEAPLTLFGCGLRTVSLRLDGHVLTSADYRLDGEALTISGVPEVCTLETEVEIDPELNTALEGLYLSRGIFLTQCEPEGFRRITWYPDRPDVLARFRVTVEGDRHEQPVLLCNGNPVDSGELPAGRHFVTWEDPFPKPGYLFALVAGKLEKVEDRFITASGREVLLQLFVEPHHLDKCAHALASLRKAMLWDEETFGLEYDLDRYMIVATDDFNMGAMENKGLNVFNSKYVLARPDTATDADFQAIEEVVAHEYFHNWTGNRVTCRDWFQLSLKEGLTVFRDQEFSADMQSRAVKRIEDVRLLRAHQLPEDAGPMAHPVRPDSYQEINNFYTATVYNKGAEVIRMLHGLLGQDGFRQGMDLYFQRHDGQAVTCDDFVAAMADANGRDLSRFRRWYEQAGTPEINVREDYDAASRRYRLTLAQQTPPTPGQTEKRPLHIPLAIGLIGPDGRDLALRLEGEAAAAGTSRVLELTEAQQTFVFEGVPARPVLSLNRSFSAPVKLRHEASEAELAFRLACDSDAFNRWDAGQQFYTAALLAAVTELRQGREPVFDERLVKAVRRLLLDEGTDPALIAHALVLPSENELVEALAVADPAAIRAARQGLRRHLAQALAAELAAAWQRNQTPGPYRIDPVDIARRRLKNVCLDLLCAGGDAAWRAATLQQFRTADNMTDMQAALQSLAHSGASEAAEALALFYQRWQNEPLVVDKWLSVQATAPVAGVLERVRQLTGHPAFSRRNPNKVRALIGGFIHANLAAFHAADGSGYSFAADEILNIAPANPQVAARLVTGFNRWRKFDSQRQALMRSQLERMQATAGLPRDLAEIVGKALAG